MQPNRHVVTILMFAAVFVMLASQAFGRNPYRKAFFNVYPSAETTQLDDVPSNASHCGVCHYDFDGGGTRNWYGAAVEVALVNAPDTETAILSIAGDDSDGDGYSNLIEVTSLLFDNTPTFPGLIAADTALVVNVTVADIDTFLTPTGGSDNTPPVVIVAAPAGGESWDAMSTYPVTWTATDASGIDYIDIWHSDDGGATYKQVAANEPDDGSFDWFVPARPGANNLIQVVARDLAGNFGSGVGGVFTINGRPAGFAPTTMRDVDMPGSQPFEANTFEDPDTNCATCHGNYNYLVEPSFQWNGSMMAQAMRDPLFLACLAVAEQDAPSVGDLCLKCHTPTGWLEGRSVDTSGGLLRGTDIEGIHCDFCHRLVDPVYKPGISPTEDVAILDALSLGPPPVSSNGGFVNDPTPMRRGPFADAVASHAFLESPFHRESDICGTCHDVSNPVYDAGATPGDYVLNDFDAPHPDGNLRNMFPIERTYSEYTQSAYANGGVFAPQFAGNKADGIIETCQDCHMRDVSGVGCSEPGAPTRPDLPLHDLTGGNYFIPDVLPAMYPGEVDAAELDAGKQRAISMLQKAATVALATGQTGNQPTVTVTVTNETAHKLPSGYPEGRRIWLNVKAYDINNDLIYESGAYDAASGVLTKDADIKVYEVKPGLSPAVAGAIGLPAGPSFHFALVDTVFYDNRIPPRGFTNANFEAVQSPPVAYTYADSQYWDETTYTLPPTANFVEVAVLYQITTKEYVEFLRDENHTNTAGDDLYNAWVAQGKAPPVTMVSDYANLTLDPTGIDDTPMTVTALYPNAPNPFNPTTSIRYSLKSRQHVSIRIYDVGGRLVRTLIDEARPAGVQTVSWHGRNDSGMSVASGVYFIEMRSEGFRQVNKAILLK